jgi:glycosyltransferase involved in cell wall biosynthesis
LNILIFSIVPLFPNYDMGGAQKHLRYIALHLGKRGHQVTILCTYRQDSPTPFQWAENVQVRPILRFKQPFPMPYDTGVYNLAAIVQDLSEALAQADRFYIHDGEMHFPYLYDTIPTVASLRDNVYPETIMGAFTFQGHALILISEFSRRVYAATVGRFFPDLRQRMQVINNGIEWTHFRYTPPREILDIVRVNPNEHAILLHPHRPEETKGIWQTIETAQLLVQRYGHHNLRVLVPQWIGTHMDGGVQEFYQRVEQRLRATHLTEHFVFHDWIPFPLLPQYYSLGQATLSLGSFVETFGNAVYESMGCGTPTIVARIATHRELLPDALIDKVDYSDTETAAAIADEILRTQRRTSAESLAYLHTHYNSVQQLARYAETIENAQVAPKPRFVAPQLTETTLYSLAPWCYRSSRGIYHDFRASYEADPALNRLLTEASNGLSPRMAQHSGMSPAEFDAWYRAGYLVPLVDA